MVQPIDIKAAYETLLAAREEQYQKEEARIEATLARETKFMEAVSEAQADGITDPARQQHKGMKATREQLTALQLAEKASRKAQHAYTMAGIRVDSLNQQLKAENLHGGDKIE